MKQKLEALFTANKVVKKIISKSKIFDLLRSRIFQGIRYQVYINLCMYNVPYNKRKDYLTNDQIYSLKYNPGVTYTNHDDKRELIKKYLPYLHRKVILDTKTMTFQNFSQFCDGLKSFFYKKYDGDGGVGIKKIWLKDWDLYKLYDYIITELEPGLLEETIKQHPDMNRLNPDCVSTIRIQMFKHKDGPRIIFTSLRTAIRRGIVVDNAASGGCFASIDPNTGIINNNAFSEKLDSINIDAALLTNKGVEEHPLTGVKFKGFKIPFFEEAISMVREMTENIDFYGRRLIAFDVAISENGPVIVEVNTTRPDIVGLWQMANKDKALKSEFENILME